MTTLTYAMYLNESQVIDMIKVAERESEVIVVRCIRKTKASKPGGPDKGDLYDLHCTTKPEYEPVSTVSANRFHEDKAHKVLTVWVTNRQDRKTKQWGQWRRVNIAQVVKLIYRGVEYEVRTTSIR